MTKEILIDDNVAATDINELEQGSSNKHRARKHFLVEREPCGGFLQHHYLGAFIPFRLWVFVPTTMICHNYTKAFEVDPKTPGIREDGSIVELPQGVYTVCECMGHLIE